MMRPFFVAITVGKLLIILIFITAALCRSKLDYHRSGRVLQLEYAKEAAKRGSPVVAVKFNDGIFLASAKKKSQRVVVEGPRNIIRLGRRIIIAVTGLLFDSFIVTEVVESIRASYEDKFSSPIPLEVLCDELANFLHDLARSNSRPIGLKILVAGWDKQGGHQIYTLDPEGSFCAWRGVTIGKGEDKSMRALAEAAEMKTNRHRPLNIDEAWKLLQCCLADYQKDETSRSTDSSVEFELYCGTLSPDGHFSWSKVE